MQIYQPSTGASRISSINWQFHLRIGGSFGGFLHLGNSFCRVDGKRDRKRGGVKPQGAKEFENGYRFVLKMG